MYFYSSRNVYLLSRDLQHAKKHILCSIYRKAQSVVHVRWTVQTPTPCVAFKHVKNDRRGMAPCAMAQHAHGIASNFTALTLATCIFDTVWAP